MRVPPACRLPAGSGACACSALPPQQLHQPLRLGPAAVGVDRGDNAAACGEGIAASMGITGERLRSGRASRKYMGTLQLHAARSKSCPPRHQHPIGPTPNLL